MSIQFRVKREQRTAAAFECEFEFCMQNAVAQKLASCLLLLFLKFNEMLNLMINFMHFRKFHTFA